MSIPYPERSPVAPSFSTVLLILILFSIVPVSAQSQHTAGDRILRGTDLEMRSYNRELGNYIGIVGFGGSMEESGPVVTSTSISAGIYPTKTGTKVVLQEWESQYGVGGTYQEGHKRTLVDKRFSGWGLDFKYQFLAYLNGKVDASGVYLRWGNSLHFANLQISYDRSDLASFPEASSVRNNLPADGLRQKIGLYFENEIGYSLDLGVPSVTIGVQGGLPLFTSFWRFLVVATGEDISQNTMFVDIDDPQLIGMPFYWGLRAGITI